MEIVTCNGVSFIKPSALKGSDSSVAITFFHDFCTAATERRVEDASNSLKNLYLRVSAVEQKLIIRVDHGHSAFYFIKQACSETRVCFNVAMPKACAA